MPMAIVDRAQIHRPPANTSTQPLHARRLTVGIVLPQLSPLSAAIDPSAGAGVAATSNPTSPTAAAARSAASADGSSAPVRPPPSPAAAPAKLWRSQPECRRRLLAYDGKVSAEAARACRRLGLPTSALDAADRTPPVLQQNARIARVTCDCRQSANIQQNGWRVADFVGNEQVGGSKQRAAPLASTVASTAGASCLFTEDGKYLIAGWLCCLQSPRDHFVAIPINSSDTTTTTTPPKRDTDSELEHRGHPNGHVQNGDGNVALATAMVPTDDVGGRARTCLSPPLLGLLDDSTVAYVSRKPRTSELVPLYTGRDGRGQFVPGEVAAAAGTATTTSSSDCTTPSSDCTTSLGRCNVPESGMQGTGLMYTIHGPTLQQRSSFQQLDERSKLVMIMESGTAVHGSAVSVNVYDVGRRQRVAKLDKRSVDILRHNIHVLGTKVLESEYSAMPVVPVTSYLPFAKQQRRQDSLQATALSKFTSAALSPNGKQLMVSTHSFFIPCGSEECAVYIADLRTSPSKSRRQSLSKSGPATIGEDEPQQQQQQQQYQHHHHQQQQQQHQPHQTHHQEHQQQSATRQHYAPVTEVKRLSVLCAQTPDSDTSVSHVSCVFHPNYSIDQQRMYALPQKSNSRDSIIKRRTTGLERTSNSLPRPRAKGGGSMTSSPIARQRSLRRRSSFSDVEATSASLKRSVACRQTCGSVAVLSVIQKRVVLMPSSLWMRVLLLHIESQTVLWEKFRKLTGQRTSHAQMLFTPDGSLLAVLLEVSRVDLYSTMDGSLLRTLNPSSANRLAPLSDIVMSVDQRHIAGIADGNRVCFWSGTVATLKHLSHLAVTRLRLEIGRMRQAGSSNLTSPVTSPSLSPPPVVRKQVKV